MKHLLTHLGVVTAVGLASLIAQPAEARDGHWRGSSHSQHGQDRGRHQSRGPGHSHHHQGRHDSRRHSHNHRSHSRPPSHRHPSSGRHHRPVYRPPVQHVHHHHYRYRAPVYYAPPPGYRPHHWTRGHYLPRPYYGPTYVIDYRPYRLAPPPYGHHWVRVDRDVLLVTLATGLIVDAVYGLFY